MSNEHENWKRFKAVAVFIYYDIFVFLRRKYLKKWDDYKGFEWRKSRAQFTNHGVLTIYYFLKHTTI